MVKTAIPGTEWLRIKTTEGNIFYTHKGRKESVWGVPEEIKDAVDALIKKEEAEAQARAEEAARVVASTKERAVKRKAEANMPMEEVIVKKAKVGDEEDESNGGDGDESESDEEEEDSDEEEWQKEAAAQLAAEAEEEKKRQEEEKQRLEKEEETRKAAEAEALKNKPLVMPERVDLSLDEAKALFKVSQPKVSF